MRRKGKKFIYEKMVRGGQIYNFYIYFNGQLRVDESQPMSPNGKVNWLFVPFGE